MDGNEGDGIVVVCDAGPLIHLDEAGCLDLLADFKEVCVPDEVWREVERHRPSALGHAVAKFRRIAPKYPEPPELVALSQVMTLHAGEREALHVVLELRPAMLLTDDTAARLAAGSLGIAAHGSIGVMVRAIRRKQRTKEEILGLLRSLPVLTTLHLSRRLLDEVIRQVESD